MLCLLHRAVMMNKTDSESRSHHDMIPKVGIKGCSPFLQSKPVSGKEQHPGFPRAGGSGPKGVKGRAKPGSHQGLQRHKLRPTGGPSGEAQSAKGPSLSQERPRPPGGKFLGSGLTPLPKTSHIPLVCSPQPAIGTSHTHAHTQSVCKMSTHPAHTASIPLP